MMVAGPGGVEVARISARVVADTSHMLEELRLDLARIESSSVLNIRTAIDNTELDAQARAAVDEAQAAAGDIKVKMNVDRSQIGEATSALGQFVENLGLVASAATVFGSALIPVVATVGALAAALAGPVFLAGAGATLFGFITGAAIKQTEAQKKKIDALAKSVASAKAALAATKASASASAANSLASAQASASASIKAAQDSAAASVKSAQQALASATTVAAVHAADVRLSAARVTLAQRTAAAETSLSTRTAGIQRSQSASVAAAQTRVNTAIKAYHDALKGLTPAQSKFLAAQENLKNAFTDLVEKIGPKILGPVTRALVLLASLLPGISPIISAFSGVFNGFLAQLGDATKTQGFKDLVGLIAGQGARAFKAFGDIVGNAAVGLGGLFGAINDRFGNSVLRGVEDLSGKFADLGKNAGKSKKLQDFLDYFHKVGPQVAATIGSVARALGHVVAAIAPLGSPALRVIKGIADAISGIPTPVLTALAAAMVATVAVGKLKGPATTVTHLIQNALSAATAGLIPGTKGKGVVPVFVTNKGFGVGEGDGAGGTLRKVAKFAGPGTLLGASIGITGVATVVIGTAVLNAKIIQAEASGTKVSAGNLTPGQWAYYNATGRVISVSQLKALNKAAFTTLNHSLNITDVQSTGTHVDALKAHLAAATLQLDQIGPHAKNSFGTAIKVIHQTNNELANIHDKKVKVLLDSLATDKELAKLQALRIKDKTFTVTAQILAQDRVVGPGGGIGHPGANTAGTPAPRSGPAIHIDKLVTQDYSDFIRQSNQRQRARAGGGVLLGVG